jgi:malonate-semialdehyde dehydrogenase (acetylating)/methylmalonate-semialdehyde dehydrogenase
MATNTIAHWINNKAYPGTSGNTSPVTTGEVTGEVASAAWRTPAR